MNTANNKNNENQSKKRRDQPEEYAIPGLPIKKMKLENNSYLYNQATISNEDKNEKYDKSDVEKDNYNYSNDNQNNQNHLNYQSQNHLEVVDSNQIKNIIYSNYLKANNLNLVWKISIPKIFLFQNYEIEHKFYTRDNLLINLSIGHNPNKKHTQSGNNFFTLKIMLESAVKTTPSNWSNGASNGTNSLTNGTNGTNGNNDEKPIKNDDETESSSNTDTDDAVPVIPVVPLVVVKKEELKETKPKKGRKPKPKLNVKSYLQMLNPALNEDGTEVVVKNEVAYDIEDRKSVV